MNVIEVSRQDQTRRAGGSQPGAALRGPHLMTPDVTEEEEFWRAYWERTEVAGENPPEPDDPEEPDTHAALAG